MDNIAVESMMKHITTAKINLGGHNLHLLDSQIVTILETFST